MTDLIILDKANRHFTKFMNLLKNQSEVRLVDLKKTVPRKSYYAIIVKKLHHLNEILREVNPKLYLAEPSLSVVGEETVFTCVKKCELIEIESKAGFFIIRCNNE